MFRKGKQTLVNEDTIAGVMAEYLVEQNRDQRLRKCWHSLAPVAKVCFGAIVFTVMKTGEHHCQQLGGNPALPHVAVVPLHGSFTNADRNRLPPSSGLETVEVAFFQLGIS